VQVLDLGVQAAACGAARCVSQVFGRGAQAAARGAVALSQQEITTRQMFSGTEPIIPAISVKPLKLAHRASSSSALS
jgi:hypothetical protein